MFSNDSMNRFSPYLEIAAVFACYLILTLPLASATTVNIRFNGQVRESVDYDPTNIVNQDVDYVRDPRDISWSNVRIAITLNSASLAHTVKRVYLYKCGMLSPVACMQKTPEVFDTYVDTEIAWKDIGQQVGTSPYPEEGNLLFLVKLEDPDGLSSWVGLWNTIRRNSHREFLFYRHELSDMEVNAREEYLIGPISSYIQNFNTIPFKWLTSASFSDALSIAAIGGDDQELETSPPSLQSVSPSGTEISVINKENYFVFPETSSGTAFPITLEENPDFQCGDGFCETSLGENQETCCFDCGCEDGQYCDSPQASPEQGSCKSESLINLDVVGTPSVDVKDCGNSFEVPITARINNIPASMEDQVTGVIKVLSTPYAVQCQKASQGLYDCSFTMRPTIQCGQGTRPEGPAEFKLTVNYLDGPDRITRDLEESFPTINLNYDCGCPDGAYCDTGTEKCESEDAISLGITELTSYLDAYSPGDVIQLKAKIFNPPTGTVLVSASAGLNLTNGIVSPGTPSCTGPSEDFEYDCRIPFSITGYSNDQDYRFFPNILSFEITYNDGGAAKTQGLSTQFGPISIPNQACGNSVCDPSESSDTCCQDCGCQIDGDYCDVVRGCSSLDAISMTTTPVPRELEDCKIPHDVALRTTIDNAPYQTQIDFSSVTLNNQPVPWGLDCPATGLGGTFDCQLSLPPQEGCELPFYTVGPAELAFTLSFPNGDPQTGTLNREISDQIEAIQITPIPHIDGVCESGLGEDGSTACLDCPCVDDPDFGSGYYCDTGTNPKGTCLPKSDISLVVESPSPGSTKTFDSCEESNSLHVLMHVKNQPYDMKAENVYATVNNQSASYVSCRESRGTYLDSNITFNCTIRIPPIDTCESGKTYTYTDNSISLVISYPGGSTVIQTLSAPLPNIRIRQSYRSLNEITSQAMDDMRDVLNNIMDITEESMDQLQNCIKMQIAMMIINMIGTLAMAFSFGNTYAQSPPEGSTAGREFTKGFSEGMQLGGQIGQSTSSIIGKWCDTLQEMSKIAIKMQELQMEKIKMDTCLAVAQHNLDTGRCKGQEESCFNNIVGCLNFGDMNSIVDSIGSSTQSINQNFASMNNEISNIGDAVGDVTWPGETTSRDLFVGATVTGTIPNQISPGAEICRWAQVEESSIFSSSCTNQQLYIKWNKPNNCEYVFITLHRAGQTPFNSINDPSKIGSDSGEKIVDIRDITGDGENVIGLYCSNDDQFNPAKDRLKESLGFTLAESNGPPDCSCTDSYGNECRGVCNYGSGNVKIGQPRTSAVGGNCGHRTGLVMRMLTDDTLVKISHDPAGRTIPEDMCDLRAGTIVETINIQGLESIRTANQKEYWLVEIKDPVYGSRYCSAANPFGYIIGCDSPSEDPRFQIISPEKELGSYRTPGIIETGLTSLGTFRDDDSTDLGTVNRKSNNNDWFCEYAVMCEKNGPEYSCLQLYRSDPVFREVSSDDLVGYLCDSDIGEAYEGLYCGDPYFCDSNDDCYYFEESEFFFSSTNVCSSA